MEYLNFVKLILTIFCILDLSNILPKLKASSLKNSILEILPFAYQTLFVISIWAFNVNIKLLTVLLAIVLTCQAFHRRFLNKFDKYIDKNVFAIMLSILAILILKGR